MEKYYIVTEKSSLHKSWFDYKANVSVVNDLVKKFTAENGIESSEYYVSDTEIYIVPSEKDVETFGKSLGATLDNGLRRFSMRSKICKAWMEALRVAELKVLRKPMVILYFRGIGGKYKSRIFDQNGVLYCSIDPADGKENEGLIEMKASEFFKIVEESESVPA
ncbi:MAG: hypothetical protein JWM44_698 [Bacilli bacterium]|nr:hypothetical protein [Bacilli bacterium]